jgi:hypothetical protein
MDDHDVEHALLQLLRGAGGHLRANTAFSRLYNRHPDARWIISQWGGAKKFCDASPILLFVRDTGGGEIRLRRSAQGTDSETDRRSRSRSRGRRRDQDRRGKSRSRSRRRSRSKGGTLRLTNKTGTGTQQAGPKAGDWATFKKREAAKARAVAEAEAKQADAKRVADAAEALDSKLRAAEAEAERALAAVKTACAAKVVEAEAKGAGLHVGANAYLEIGGKVTSVVVHRYKDSRCPSPRARRHPPRIIAHQRSSDSRLIILRVQSRRQGPHLGEVLLHGRDNRPGGGDLESGEGEGARGAGRQAAGRSRGVAGRGRRQLDPVRDERPGRRS